MRQDLFDVLAYARDRGIVSNLTTNGVLLTLDAVRRLEWAGVARVNLSWCGPGTGEQDYAVARPQDLNKLPADLGLPLTNFLSVLGITGLLSLGPHHVEAAGDVAGTPAGALVLAVAAARRRAVGEGIMSDGETTEIMGDGGRDHQQ